jgi:hypothetical protein
MRRTLDALPLWLGLTAFTRAYYLAHRKLIVLDYSILEFYNNKMRIIHYNLSMLIHLCSDSVDIAI